MSSTTTNVGIRLSLQGAQEVESGLGRVQALAGDAARTMAGLAAGTFSAAAFTAWVKGAIDAADETDELAQKTGLLAKEVAGLKLLFEQEGLGDAFGGTMAKLAREASEGNKAFAAMGVSVNGATGQLKSTRQLLGEVADKFAGYADGPEKAALAMELFGKSGADLIPLLNGGAQSLDDFDRKAEQLGLTLSAETAAAAAQFNDQLFLLSKNGQGAATAIAVGLLPALVAVTEELAKGGQQGSVLTSVSNGLATAFEAASVFGLNVAYVLKQVGNELGGLAAQAAQVAQFNFSGAAEIGRMMRADAEAARREIDATSERIVNARRRMAIGVISPDDQSAAEARRLGLSSGRSAAPALPDEAKAKRAGRAAAGDPFAADRDAAKAWADAVGDFSKIAAEAEAKTLGLSRAQARLVEYLQSPAYKNASEPMRELALQQAYVAIGAEQAAEAMKMQEDQRIKSIAQENEWIRKQQEKVLAIQDQARLQREAAEEIGVEGQALINLRYERELSRAARKDEDAAILESMGFRQETINLVKAEAAAIREAAEASKAYSEKKAFNDYWKDVNRTAESVFMDIAMNGEDAFKRIGQSIKREVIQLLYEMTIKKWIFQIAGVSSGGIGGGGMDWTSIATKVYEYYAGSSAASTAAVSAGAGTVNTTTLSGVSAASSGYTGVAGGSAAASTGTASSTMTSGGFTGYGWMGYAALIAVAVMVAENLYSKGYNRMALGKGDGETNRFGYTNFQSDPNMGNSTAYNISPENRSRMIFDSLGMNEKWADILSGSVRMATLFGRKLGAYGYEAQIAGGDAEVGGFARYKGGLFRSNKTVGIEIDERDAAKVDAIVESTIEGARGMARAMGYSSEAIDAYTGSIKVNMKGAETAEEQSKRMAEAMDELQFSLLKAAAGGKYTRAEFEKMMEGVRQSIENAGISVEGITGVLTNGIMNGLSGEEIGASLSEMILGGIVQTFAQQAFAPVAQAMMSQIITPIFTAIAAGVPISQAVSKAAMASMVESARQSMEVLNAIFNSEEMKAFFASLNESFKGVGQAAAGVKVPNFKAPAFKPIDTTAADTAREREQLELELLRLQGNTVELRKRELAALKPVNRALQEQIWALEDVNKLKDAWTGLTDSIEEEIKRLRGLALGESNQALAYVEAQYLIASGQARAMDQDAAAKLPELSSQLAELYLNTAGSRSEYQARINNLAASLEETNRITRATAGVTDEGAQKVKDEALAQQVKLLQQSIDVLTARMEENNKAANITAAALNKASTPAGLRTVPA